MLCVACNSIGWQIQGAHGHVLVLVHVYCASACVCHTLSLTHIKYFHSYVVRVFSLAISALLLLWISTHIGYKSLFMCTITHRELNGGVHYSGYKTVVVYKCSDDGSNCWFSLNNCACLGAQSATQEIRKTHIASSIYIYMYLSDKCEMVQSILRYLQVYWIVVLFMWCIILLFGRYNDFSMCPQVYHIDKNI